MAVTETHLDAFQYLLSKERVLSPFGPVDGLYFAKGEAIGTATGGAVTINLVIARDRKTDWIHIIQGVSLLSSHGAASTASITVATGPAIRNQDGPNSVGNPTFRVAGPVLAAPITAFPGAGKQPWDGMFAYGDQQIAGDWLIMVAIDTLNNDSSNYTFSSWGYILQPTSFYQGRRAR